MNPEVLRRFIITEAELVLGLAVIGLITRFHYGAARWGLLAMELGLSLLVTPPVVLVIQWLGWRRHNRSVWPLSAVFIIFVISNLLRELYVPALAPGLLGLLLMFAFATVMSVPITWASPMEGAEIMSRSDRH